MEKARASGSGKLHVLIVDDSVAALNLTEAWLRSAGHEVTKRTAAVGTAADVVQLRPDVALLEVLMPGLRGDDLARLLKRHPATRGVAVILYSAMPSIELRPLIMTTGALGVIEKTSNQALFLFSFNSLTTKLRGAQARQQIDSAPATSGTFPIESKSEEDTPAQVPVLIRPAADKRR